MRTAGVEEALAYGVHVVHGPVRNRAATTRVLGLVGHVESSLHSIDVEPRVHRLPLFLTMQLGAHYFRPPAAGRVR